MVEQYTMTRDLLGRQVAQEDFSDADLAAPEIPDPGPPSDAGMDRPELEKRHY